MWPPDTLNLVSQSTYDLGQWTQRTGHLIHPASTVCSLLDALRAVVLLNDVIMVPYVIAFEIQLKGWLFLFAVAISSFWTLDILVNFCTGYIHEGHVVMQGRSIAKRYVKRGFLVDFVALMVDVVDIVASTLTSRMASGSLQIFKVLRFFKITRLVRLVAKLRAGLLARIEGALYSWIYAHGLHGFQHRLNFIAFILKLCFVIAWLGHIGACLWSFLERVLASSGHQNWHQAMDSELSSYMQGLYWSVSTMFAGASHTHPVNQVEVFFATMWLVMGAMFVTCITSSLAATLINSHEKRQDISKKIQALNAFMRQQKTPVLLSLSVQANFNEKIMAPRHVTELDLPFLELLAPGLRAALRENQYSESFLLLPSLRMLSVMQENVLQALAFEASTITTARDGEEVFQQSQEMEHAILVSRGSMKYNSVRSALMPCLSPAPERLTRYKSEQTQMRLSVINAIAWVCEMALMVTWTTLGSLTAVSECELLLLSTEPFIKVVASNPAVAAVAASFAVQLCEVINAEENRMNITDIDPGVDHDVVVSKLHVAIRGGLVSQPILETLRRNQRLRGFLHGTDFGELEEELRSGKCHLVLGPDGPSCIIRCVRVVVLRLTDRYGNLCVQLGEMQSGACAARFVLPGSKILGNESPEQAVRRLVDNKLHTMCGLVPHAFEISVEYGSSESYGLTTKYIKHVFAAELPGHLEKDETMVPLTSEPRLGRMNSAVSGRSEASQVQHFIRHRIGRIWSDWSDYVRRPASDSAVTTASFSVTAFSTDGTKHAFALPQKTLQQGSETSDSQACGLQHGKFRVYRWMDENEFATLSTRRADVESELTPVLSSLSVHEWRSLLSWKMKKLEMPNLTERNVEVSQVQVRIASPVEEQSESDAEEEQPRELWVREY